MSDQELLSRIVTDGQVLAGKPVISGTRLSVGFILNLLAHGAPEQEILNEYPGIIQEDIHACLLFASQSVESMEFMPLSPEPV